MAGLEDFCAQPIEGRDGRVRPCDLSRHEHYARHLRHAFRPWVYGPDGYVPAPPCNAQEAS